MLHHNEQIDGKRRLEITWILKLNPKINKVNAEIDYARWKINRSIHSNQKIFTLFIIPPLSTTPSAPTIIKSTFSITYPTAESNIKVHAIPALFSSLNIRFLQMSIVIHKHKINDQTIVPTIIWCWYSSINMKPFLLLSCFL